MTLYMGMILLIELMMLTMTIHVWNYSGFTLQQRRWYVATFICIMVCAGTEFLAKYYDGRGLGKVLTPITILQFSLTPMIPVFFAGALGIHEKAKRAACVLSLNVLAEIVMAPAGLIFFFDETGKYFRAEYYFIYEFSYILSIVFLLRSLSAVGKSFRRRDLSTIVMVFVILATSIIPMIFFKIYINYLGIAFCACLCYIYYNDLTQEDLKAVLVENQKKMSETQERIISGLANLIENRDVETGEHVSRTSDYVKKIAECARKDGVYADKMDDQFVSMMYTLAPLHDIGKIVVSDRILRKPGKLTTEEFEMMKRHASEGGKVIRGMLKGVADDIYVSFAADIATYHHERWDGGGYPTGLAGEQIPLSARIMALADVYDALVSERCYKKAMPPEEALKIIKEESGSHFDPRLTDVFIRHSREICEDRRRYPEAAGG